MITAAERAFFDELLDEQVAALPEALHELLERVPLIVDDEPTPQLLDSLGMEAGEDLCGLHDGVPITERSVEAPVEGPEQMMLFRGPIVRLAEATAAERAAGRRDYPDERAAELERQIHITLLHEIGHHFGLEEEDLEALGYG
jgi:predicted Zn-dependent protease with MMP-like domain